MALIHWWRLQGNFNDSVGTNHGTASGSPTSTAIGQTGQCYYFDGTDDQASISAVSSNTMTISCWFKVAKSTTGHCAISCNNTALVFTCNDASSYICYLHHNGTSGVLYWKTIDMTGLQDKWNHFVLTKNYDTYVMWFNGISHTQNGSGGGQSVASNLIGYYNTRRMKGYLDEIMLWDEVLTANQIMNLYNQQKRRFCL